MLKTYAKYSKGNVKYGCNGAYIVATPKPAVNSRKIASAYIAIIALAMVCILTTIALLAR